MADTRSIRANSHRAAVTQKRKLGLWIALGVFLVGSAIAYAMSSPFAMAFAFVAAVGVAKSSWEGTRAREAGAIGEESGLTLLRRLPADYKVFNQVLVPSARGKPREIDFAVVGPNGVFVVEIKHNHGRITGHVDEASWSAMKVGRGGTRYATRVRNPVQQVRGATAVLAAWLKAEGVKTWVQGIVVFTNDHASLDIRGSTDIPIARAGSLVMRILESEPKRKLGPQEEAEAAIQRLLDPTWNRQARELREEAGQPLA